MNLFWRSCQSVILKVETVGLGYGQAPVRPGQHHRGPPRREKWAAAGQVADEKVLLKQLSP